MSSQAHQRTQEFQSPNSLGTSPFARCRLVQDDIVRRQNERHPPLHYERVFLGFQAQGLVAPPKPLQYDCTLKDTWYYNARVHYNASPFGRVWSSRANFLIEHSARPLYSNGPLQERPLLLLPRTALTSTWLLRLSTRLGLRSVDRRNCQRSIISGTSSGFLEDVAARTL